MRHANHPLFTKTAGLLLCLALNLLPATAQSPVKANATFEKLKTLVGEWEGKTSEGKTVRVSYKVVSNGSSLLEMLYPPDESEMVTMYHPDGTDVLVTHYCAANNQPRMRAKSPAGNAREIAFAFVDVTNLASPAAGHMRALVITFEDEDRFSQKWTWTENGREETEIFRYTRKK